MEMVKARRSSQVLAGILAALSLCVSSVAACACTHHHPAAVQVETEQSSCHGPAHQAGAASRQETPDEADERNGIDSSCECFMQAAPRASIKNENLKVGKQAMARTVTDPETVIVQVGASYVSNGFYSPEIFVSDPYYNLTPGRAPPRL